MNKSYIYVDGKVIISDDNGHYTDDIYYENLDKVLVQQNLIEEMENRIEELSKTIVNKKIKKFWPRTLIICLLVLASIISIPYLLDVVFDTKAFLTNVNTLCFNNVNLGWLVTSILATVTIPMCALVAGASYSDYIEVVKDHEGKKAELKFLKSKIKEEKENLVKLQMTKSESDNKTDFRVVNVNDIEKLNELKKRLQLYYNLGYDQKKYLKQYINGTSDETLKKFFSESEIGLAKEYLEEKKLILRKTKR